MIRNILAFFMSLAITGLVFSAAGGSIQEEQDAESPPPYKSSTSLSLLFTAGNTEASTFALDTEQILHLEKDRFEIKGSAISSRNDGAKTSEFYYGHLKYKREFSERVYFLALGRYEKNELAGYLHRILLTGGVGYVWSQKEGFDFSTEASIGWNSEKNMIVNPVPDLETHPGSLGNDTLSFLSLLVSNALKVSLSPIAYFDIQEMLFFNLKESNDYRVSSLISLTADINKFLALKLSYQIHYNHQPVPGFKNADHYIFSSLVVNF